MALIQITDLTFTYPGSFDPVFEHVSFQLDTDWRLGLTRRSRRSSCCSTASRTCRSGACGASWRRYS